MFLTEEYGTLYGYDDSEYGILRLYKIDHVGYVVNLSIQDNTHIPMIHRLCCDLNSKTT